LEENMDSSALYPSGAAAMFARAARSGRCISFLCNLDVQIDKDVVLQGERVTVMQDGPEIWWVWLGSQEETIGWMTAQDVNMLAGKKLVEG
jgi:hypothetical protein